jgi:hypothetical protein
VRDLIEAGLSEPADARGTYGISATKLVAVGRTWMIQDHHANDDDAELIASDEAIGAPIGNLHWLSGSNSVRRADMQDTGHGGASRSAALVPQRCCV